MESVLEYTMVTAKGDVVVVNRDNYTIFDNYEYGEVSTLLFVTMHIKSK
jgi:hypothetical protein